jgi:DNA-binding NtrC family response regulator
VARSAATIPASLIDAELFGNVKGYPNPGMPERPGLIGAAEGGTLFLDELGELPASLQANLLRVLDSGGEYHRLGASTARRADIRLVGATNRDPATLKHDLAARLPLCITLPGLTQRREDIPLLVRHILRRAAAKSPDVVGRFVAPSQDGSGEPQIRPELVDHLLKWAYTTNIRELEALLWRCMAASSGDAVEWATDLARSTPVKTQDEAARGPTAPEEDTSVELSAEQIQASLAAHGGNISRAAHTLGLSSRYALYRLLKKHGIDAG